MNYFSPSPFNEPIAFFNTNPTIHNSFSQRQPVFHNRSTKSQFAIMNDGKASAADDFDIGGGSKGNMTPLPLDFIPGNYDVLCGRGKKNYDSPGNQRLRRIVESYVERYSAASSRQDKSDILVAIVDEVRSATGSPMGGFIKQDGSGRWFEVGDFLSREKVSQAFRDALSDNYRSSKKFKHEKRRQRDKAAKAAKQKGSKDGDKKPAATKGKKVSPKGSQPLLRRQSLSALREEIMSAPAPLVTTGQGDVQLGRPGRVMSLGHGAPSFSQGLNSLRPGIGDQLATHHAGYPSFNNQGVQGHSNQHTPSWSNNPIYNPIHSGIGFPTNNNIAMSQQQQRRFSDMMVGANQPPLQFEQQFGSNSNWGEQQQMQQPMNVSAFGVGAADLNASFPSGLGMGMPSQAATGFGGIARMQTANALTGMMYSEGAGFSPMQFHRQQQQQQLAAGGSLMGGDSSSRSMVQSGGGNRRPASPLLRSGSNVSTASGTGAAIVERLESVLPVFPNNDENPFEPVPLPREEQHHNNNQANNHGGDDDDNSIHPYW